MHKNWVQITRKLRWVDPDDVAEYSKHDISYCTEDSILIIEAGGYNFDDHGFARFQCTIEEAEFIISKVLRVGVC